MNLESDPDHNPPDYDTYIVPPVSATLPSTLFQNQALNTKITAPKSLQQNYWPSAVLYEKPVYS